MPNRVIREDLFESDRWLDLHTDSARLMFIVILLLVDDFGNLEGGRRLQRRALSTTQIKDLPTVLKVLSELQDADLIRRYEVDGREYWHVPRFKNLRTYWSRKFPRSPWCGERKSAIEKKNKSLT